MSKPEFKKAQWVDVAAIRQSHEEPPTENNLTNRVRAVLPQIDAETTPAVPATADPANMHATTAKHPKTREFKKTQPMQNFLEQAIVGAKTYRELRNLFDYNLSANGTDIPSSYITVDDRGGMQVQMMRIAEELETAYQQRNPLLAPDFLGIQEALRRILAIEDEVQKKQPTVSLPRDNSPRRGPTTKNPELAKTVKVDRPKFGDPIGHN